MQRGAGRAENRRLARPAGNRWKGRERLVGSLEKTQATGFGGYAVVHRLFSFGFAAVVSLSSVASAQVPDGPLPPLAQAELRLEQTFETYAQWGEVGRYIMGIGGSVLGPAAIGTGLYFMLDEGSIDREDRRLLTGGILIGVGAVALAGGIVSLLSPSFGTERLERFQRAREGGLTERELGHFEGQLRLDAERGRRRRLSGRSGPAWQRWSAAGRSSSQRPPRKPPQGDEEVGYVLGGVVAGVGALTMIKSLLFESHSERVWRAYLENDAAPEETTVDLVPSAGPGAARLDLVGRF